MRKKAVRLLFIIATLMIVAIIVKRNNKKNMIYIDRSKFQDKKETDDSVRSI